MFKTIFFIHENKGLYPEVTSTIELYSARYKFKQMTFAEAQVHSDIESSLCWHIMGVYTKKLPAAVTIHDYRSLSVGRFRKSKDFIKRQLNCRPDMRIFQPSIVKYFNFKDNIPTFLLDMGISDSVLVHRTRKACEKRFDFCYVGAMIAERKIEVMIDSFLSRYDKRKTLVLVGDAAPYLVARYSRNINVIFLGKVPQSKVFDLINLSNVCVAYFPNHFPHIIQTPTKLLEYAVLGAKILANDQIMNRRKAEQFGMRVVWGPADDMFNNAPDTFDGWPDNYNVDPTPMLWSSQLRQSGVLAILEDPDNYFADRLPSSSDRVI